MPRKSKIIKALKEEEIQRYKKMTPQQRISMAIAHNDLIKSIFGAGLKSEGFSSEQINSIWMKQYE